MKEIAETLFNVFMFAFVASSMISSGLGLTISEIKEPLKNIKMVTLSLIANFVLVPLFAFGIVWAIPVSEGLRIGIILLSISGGAAFIPNIVKIAKGRIGGAVGLMILLLIITIFLMPIVVPLIFQEATVSSWEIAKSLIVSMFIPLLIALFIKARFPDIAKRILPFFIKFTNFTVLMLIILVIFLYTNVIIANANILPVILLFFLGAMAIGYFTGGKNRNARIILSVGTGLRNPPIAILVGSQYFVSEPIAAITPLLGMIIGLAILFPLAKIIGRKA